MIKLPYPITHLHECMNTAPEWHAFLIGLATPACKLWRIGLTIDFKGEVHYFVVGVLLSTIAMVWSTVLIVKIII